MFGVNLTIVFFHVTGSNLRHSHININYWPWLERLLMSPAQDQLHHSVAEEHYDKSFGAGLSIWDWMFGSMHLSEPDRELTYGLDLSRFRTAPSARLGDFSLESDGAFPTQC